MKFIHAAICCMHLCMYVCIVRIYLGGHDVGQQAGLGSIECILVWSQCKGVLKQCISAMMSLHVKLGDMMYKCTYVYLCMRACISVCIICMQDCMHVNVCMYVCTCSARVTPNSAHRRSAEWPITSPLEYSAMAGSYTRVVSTYM